MTQTTQTIPTTGCRLVAADGRELLLQTTRLTARAGGGLCRVRLEQTFHNPYAEALTLTYLLPLPADGAVRGFAFRIGDRRIQGEIDRRQAARERFERAVVEGRTAALLEQDRSSLFTQEIGNVPPGATVTAEIDVDQPLLWVQEGHGTVGGWEWRFPTTVAPRYMGAHGRVSDAGKTMVDVAGGALPPRLHLCLDVGDAITGAVTSPSHAIFARAAENGSGSNGNATQVGLTAEAGAQLDRDVVIRWPAAAPQIGSRLEVARAGEGLDGLHGLLTLVPPAGEVGSVVSRDVIVLLDTSGSMSGEPLEQARAVVSALVDSLGASDRLEMIEFSNQPRRWKRQPKVMKPGNKVKAQSWLSGLRAGGGTEMHSAVLEAVQVLGEGSQRQILLVTDGLIGFETEIVTAILDHMPVSSRFHVVAVGSAPNRSLTQAAARAGRGIERGVQLGEDPAPLARQLVAHTAQPLVVDLQLSGSAFLESAPERLPDLFAGCPSRVAVRLRSEGGELILRGRRADGPFEQRLVVEAAVNEGREELVTWFGREKIEDLEMRVAKGEQHDAAIESVALRYQIASRMTSWVAIHEEQAVDPTVPTRRQTVPHELPHGMSMAGLGLRPCAAPATSVRSRRQAAVGHELDGFAEEESAAGSGAFSIADATTAMPRPAPQQEGTPSSSSKAPKKAESPRDAKERSKADDEVLGRSVSPVLPAAVPPTVPPIWGRFVRLADGSLVVEFAGNDLLALGLSHWELPKSVQLTFEGRVLQASLDAAASSAAGSPLANVRLRLRLVLPTDAPNDLPVNVSFAIENRQVVVLVQPA